MAVLTVTEPVKRLCVGDKILKTFRTSALGTASAVEWISTGLSWIDAVIGIAVIGTTTSTVALAVTKNAQGTGVAEGTNPGDLGIESTDAGINVVEVTVLGRAG
jgi:hypothetical protein